MGSYPVFAKVDFDALQRFKTEFNISTDEGDLDLILKLHSIFDGDSMLFFDGIEFNSKSYWDNVHEMPLLKEFRAEDGRVLRFIKFEGVIDYLLPSEDFRSEVAQKLREVSKNIEDAEVVLNVLLDYKNLDTYKKKADYIGNLMYLLDIIKGKTLDEKYIGMSQLDAKGILENFGFNKCNLVRGLFYTPLHEGDLLVIYGV